ncbi:hypothetical protein NEDG_00390 [Nematocida displodere]|uniref:C2H2-type domain-containing protein n=1 Tax=Nematocida displodere TaxID=1805483 RepID=A0A177EIY3_9MICR|nr:hypothetical protein NEDG_00390 [Nematocida displodere]
MECRWNSCKEQFNDQKDFSAHVNKHIRDSDAKACQWRECTRMNEKKISRCTLLMHIRMHTREKPFKCKLCPKEYSRSDALSKHTKTHEQLAADENIYIKKLSYLSTLQIEHDLLLKEAQQMYKRLMVENDILIKYICSNIRRPKRIYRSV